MTIRSSFLAGILLLAWCSVLRASAETPSARDETALQPDGSVRFVVQGEFRPSVASARESALQVAQERMREWLAKQNPPIRRVPSLETIRREMIRHELSPQEEQILNRKDKMYKVTLEVELQPKQVRSLRERDRVITGMWTLGGLLAILGVLALLFRIDEWTKGYLTRWLIAAGIAAVLLLLAGWFFVH
jgi:hypothetical protein